MERKGSDPDIEASNLLASDPLEAQPPRQHTANGFRPAVIATSTPAAPRSRSARSLPSRVVTALLPSFLQPSTRSSNAAKPPALHASTLYLDGLRGYASICVLNSHVVCGFSNAPQIDWGWGENMSLTPTNLPLLRLLYSGPGMVTLFFLVSGFSCCLKPLEAMASSDVNAHAKALRNLSSSLMRRWFRLYLPVLACTLLVTLFVYLGGFASMAYFMGDPNMLHQPERYISQQPSLYLQLQGWAADMSALLNIWRIWPNGQPDTGYYAPLTNPHMWFVTVEFKASLVLYTMLLALAIARPTQRFLAFMAGAAFMFFACKDEILPYFVGACLAHMKLTIDAQRSPTSLPGSSSSGYEKSAANGPWNAIPAFARPLVYGNTSGTPRVIWSIVLVLSIWLMSTPAWVFNGPLFVGFTYFVPAGFVRQQTLMQLIGVAGLLLCLMTSSPTSRLRRFLTTPLALYLGRISFAVYIVHGPVLLAIGYAVPIAMWRMFGDGPVMFVLGIAACEVVTIVLSVWIADVFNREVEGRCVRLTKRIEDWMVGKK